jgi:hypothetical protein
MARDAIRICIGPWKGRYSSMWRIWGSSNSDDIYLAVRSLAQSLKISLHQSGDFRAAFTEQYSTKITKEGKDRKFDRAFMKWTKIPVPEGTIMQALDIHFPLEALSLVTQPRPIKGRKQFILTPDEGSLRDNDSVTVKVLFHRAHPESEVIKRAFAKQAIMPMFWVELRNGEYVSFVSQYTKQLPFDLKAAEGQKIGHMMRDYFKRTGSAVGAKNSNLTMQFFRMGLPPSVLNLGNLSVQWEEEKKISVAKAS